MKWSCLTMKMSGQKFLPISATTTVKDDLCCKETVSADMAKDDKGETAPNDDKIMSCFLPGVASVDTTIADDDDKHRK